MEIFKLFGSIFIDDKGANEKIDGVDSKAKNTGSTLGSMIGTAVKWGAGIAAGASVAGAGLFALASKVSDTASEINDMSVRTGLSTKTLQEMKFATGQVGVSFESITGAVGKLTRTMSGAEDGGKKAEEAFKKLGISTSDSGGHLRKMDDIFPEVIKKLAGMTNETDRNALAMDFFGKGALELAPLLAAGGDGIDALSQQAHALGLVMSDEAISAGDKFGDSLDAIKAALGGVVAKVGVELMPMFQTMMDWVIAHMPEIQTVIHTTFSVAGDVIGTVITAIQLLTQFFTAHWDVIMPILAGIAAGALTFGIYTLAINASAMATSIWTTVTGIATTAGTAFGAVMAFITSPIGIVVIAIGLLVAAGILLYKNWDEVSAFLDKSWKWVKDTAVAVFNGVKDFFVEHWQLILAIFTGPIGLLVLLITSNWDLIKNTTVAVFTSVKDIVIGIWDGIVGGIKGAINIVIGAINSFINGINSIHISIPSVKIPFTDKVIGGGEIGFPNIPNIPMLAKGGDITEGGRVLVGEVGPEILDVPKGARVTPLDKDSTAGKTEIINHYYTVEAGALVIPVKDLAEIKTAQEFFARFQQVARAKGMG